LAEVEGGGATAVQFAWGGALVMLISGIGRLSGGMILFRFRAALIANGSIVVLSVLFIALFLIRQPFAVLILALSATWFASINFGAFFHLISRSTSEGSMATLLGMVNMLANLGAVAVTIMFGWLKDDLGSFNAGFLVLSATCLTTLMLGWRSLEK
jgi:nitrate/nitrite transporter NarK